MDWNNCNSTRYLQIPGKKNIESVHGIYSDLTEKNASNYGSLQLNIIQNHGEHWNSSMNFLAVRQGQSKFIFGHTRLFFLYVSSFVSVLKLISKCDILRSALSLQPFESFFFLSDKCQHATFINSLYYLWVLILFAFHDKPIAIWSCSYFVDHSRLFFFNSLYRYVGIGHCQHLILSIFFIKCS